MTLTIYFPLNYGLAKVNHYKKHKLATYLRKFEMFAGAYQNPINRQYHLTFNIPEFKAKAKSNSLTLAVLMSTSLSLGLIKKQ